MLHMINGILFFKSFSKFIFSSCGQNFLCYIPAHMLHKSCILIAYFETCQFYYELVLYFKHRVLARELKGIPPSYGVETFPFYFLRLFYPLVGLQRPLCYT